MKPSVKDIFPRIYWKGQAKKARRIFRIACKYHVFYIRMVNPSNPYPYGLSTNPNNL